VKYVVLLRGINVGGINIKMVDLRKALEDAGFGAVKTILASGNVLVESDQKAPAVKKLFEHTLTEAFGYEAWVIVLDPDDLAQIVADYPFDPEADGMQPYVMFSSDGASTKELAKESESLDPEIERIAPGAHGVLYWEVQRGHSTDSHLGKLSARARYKSTTTTRNIRTLNKLLA
jgi:uncharacterized protein (DUF1697 family)